MIDDKLLNIVFFQFFPELKNQETKIIKSKSVNGNDFYYVQSGQCQLKVFFDRVETWEAIGTKNPRKTLELSAPTIIVLKMLYAQDSKDSGTGNIPVAK